MSITQFPRVIAALARGALRSIAGQLRRGLSGLGIINWIRRTFAPLTTTEASVLKNLTGEYLSAGAQQEALPQGATLNPANVPSVTQAGMPSGSTGSVQYDTRVHWRDQSTGKDYWRTIFIDAQGLLTSQDLLTRIDQQFTDSIGVSPPAGSGGEPTSPSIISFSIYGVVQA